MRVLVGMSGGVDSSVAALILKQEGYEVVGATMKTWGNSSFFKNLNSKLQEKGQKNFLHGACLCPDEENDVSSARAVADKLGIEFHEIDVSDDYENIVINYFKDEYLKGNTPNPCVRCNRLIKFGVFPELARQSGITFDKFATGHYARIVFENGRYLLKRGINPKKDQSYFLYGLSQEQLSGIILPLGNYTKDKIREIARNNGLEVADKPDSQDFYNGDYNDILNQTPKEGNIVDLKGNVLGIHQGFWNYTIGQRKGIGVAAKAPLYVIELRKDTNEVVVGYKEEAVNQSLIVCDVTYSAIEELKEPLKCTVKIRSSQEPKAAVIKPVENCPRKFCDKEHERNFGVEFIKGEQLYGCDEQAEGCDTGLNKKVRVDFMEIQSPIAKGQSCVFYDDDTVLGGGIIEEVL